MVFLILFIYPNVPVSVPGYAFKVNQVEIDEPIMISIDKINAITFLL